MHQKWNQKRARNANHFLAPPNAVYCILHTRVLSGYKNVAKMRPRFRVQKLALWQRENVNLRFQKQGAVERAIMRKPNSENDCQSVNSRLSKYTVAIVRDMCDPRCGRRACYRYPLKLARTR